MVAAPRTGDRMLALEIASQAAALGDKTLLPLDFSMARNPRVREEEHRAAANAVKEILLTGMDVAMVVLGDASIYASSGYLTERLATEGFDCQIIPGVPSFCAAAAALGVPLAREGDTLTILPATAGDVGGALDFPGTKVLMKSGRQLATLRAELERRGALERAFLAVNCGLEGELLCPGGADWPEATGYYTTIIVKE